MVRTHTPAENPAGDGPSDTNPLLDALRDGEVLKRESDIITVYFQMVSGGRINRVSFAGSFQPVRKLRPMDPLSFAMSVSRSMHAGLSEFSLTTPEELEQRERDHRVALAFRGLWRMEREVGGDE